MPTTSPNREVRRSSSSLTCGSAPRRPRVGAWRGRAVSRRTSSSVSRTLRPWSTTAAREPLGLRAADQGSRVAGRQAAVRDQRLHGVGQREQAQGVGDVAAALADALASSSWVWPNSSISRRKPWASSSGDRSVALDVLDQGELERVLVGRPARRPAPRAGRRAAPRASAARRRRSRNRHRPWRTGAPGAAAGCRARGSRRRAPRARPRRTAAGAACGEGRRNSIGTPGGAACRRRSRRVDALPAAEQGGEAPCRAHGGAGRPGRSLASPLIRRRRTRRRSRRSISPKVGVGLAPELVSRRAAPACRATAPRRRARCAG